MKPAKAMRALSIGALMAAASTVWAADDPVVSKVMSNSLAEVRAVIESFCAQAPTNIALRPFASPLFSSLGVRQRTNGFAVSICDCATVSPCYEISATAASPETTRIEVGSLDASPDNGRAGFRPKRNVRVMEELLRLLEKKP